MASVSVYLQGGVWKARASFGRDELTGRQRRRQRAFPEARTREEAREMAEAWLDGAQGALVGDMLAEFAETCAALGAPRSGTPKANTAHSYRSMARRCAEMLPKVRADEVTPRHITALERRMLAEGLSMATVNTCYQFLSSAFGWAVEQGIVENDPTVTSAHPRQPRPKVEERVYDEGECRRIMAWMEAAEADGRRPRWQREAAFGLILMLETGMRGGEALALRCKDVADDGRSVVVRGTVTERGGLRRQPTPKRDRQRTVALSEAEGRRVEAHMWEKRRDEPLVGEGRLMAPKRLREVLRECCGELGIRYRPPHALRHAHATLLLNAGASTGGVSRRLGHAKSSTTIDQYQGFSPAEDRALAEAMAHRLGEEG